MIDTQRVIKTPKVLREL